MPVARGAQRLKTVRNQKACDHVGEEPVLNASVRKITT